MYMIFTLLAYLFLYLALFVVFLSMFGLTTGIREACAKFILFLFEWAAHQKPQPKEEEDEEEEVQTEESEAEDNLTGLRNHKKLKRQHSNEQSSIIVRRWSSSLNAKLKRSSTSHTHLSDSSDLEGFDAIDHSDCGTGRVDPSEHQTVKVIVNDTWEFLNAGIEAIIEDEVTTRFETAQLASWNFLLRSRANYVYISWKLSLIWFVGLIFRYGILFPVRLLLFFISMVLLLFLPAMVGCVPHKKTRSVLNQCVMLMCMRISSRTFSTIVTFHNKENRPSHGICVANHTSPIDGGILGILQRALSRSSDHIWFERSEASDRKQVSKRLKEHVEDPNKLPILIFPEGTCINNTGVMLFKKGSFEVSTTIYPIAIKYDNRLGDPFWNSHKQGYMTYLLSMMTAWALMCDVHYLPPVYREEGESSIEFARRVQRLIAKEGGLIDLDWDGNLKRTKVPEKLKKEQKELFYQHLARTTSICSCGTEQPNFVQSLKSQVYPEIYEESNKQIE
uniref:Phospholipid/glycerol acyltransferase domain-containing protein n=1 Tax=Ditylenchus dipsaci TaxID=166011 RepID=A0A915ENF8_9BILA